MKIDKTKPEKFCNFMTPWNFLFRFNSIGKDNSMELSKEEIMIACEEKAFVEYMLYLEERCSVLVTFCGFFVMRMAFLISLFKIFTCQYLSSFESFYWFFMFHWKDPTFHLNLFILTYKITINFSFAWDPVIWRRLSHLTSPAECSVHLQWPSELGLGWDAFRAGACSSIERTWPSEY